MSKKITNALFAQKDARIAELTAEVERLKDRIIASNGVLASFPLVDGYEEEYSWSEYELAANREAIASNALKEGK